MNTGPHPDQQADELGAGTEGAEFTENTSLGADPTKPEEVPMTATEVMARINKATAAKRAVEGIPHDELPNDFRHPQAIMSRLRQYAVEVEGGTAINLEAMVIDCVTAFKLGGKSKKDLNEAYNILWRMLQPVVLPPGQ